MPSFIMSTPLIRQNALDAVRNAPDGWSVTVSERKRSGIQNNKLWAMLADVANAAPEGRQWTPETWKCAFLHSLGHQVRFAEGLDGSGPFPLGFSSSKMSISQMADLITTIYQYGDKHGVVWKESMAGGYADFIERAGE